MDSALSKILVFKFFQPLSCVA